MNFIFIIVILVNAISLGTQICGMKGETVVDNGNARVVRYNNPNTATVIFNKEAKTLSAWITAYTWIRNRRAQEQLHSIEFYTLNTNTKGDNKVSFRMQGIEWETDTEVLRYNQNELNVR